MSYRVARSLAEVASAVTDGSPDLLVMAGGTDVQVRARDAVRGRPVLDVARVAELRRVERDETDLVLGAAVTYAECLADPRIRTAAPLLARVAERFASPQIRAVATLGGNVANASPAGDGVAALWALDARVDALTPDGPVTWPIEQVVVGPGRLGLPAGSVLTGFRVPVRVACEGQGFYKLVNRAWPEHPMAIAVASAAVRLVFDAAGRVRLARVVLGAVAPTPVRATRAEALLEGRPATPEIQAEAAAGVVDAARPVTDLRATEWYRRQVLPTIAAAALVAAVGTRSRA
jgi:CO/xanthine dehydrogenase FAD-binding subunit